MPEALLYCRAAGTPGQDTKHYLHEQEAALHAHATAVGYAVGHTICDVAEARTRLGPELEAALPLIESGQYAAVFIQSPDRLCGETAVQQAFLDRCAAAGVAVHMLLTAAQVDSFLDELRDERARAHEHAARRKQRRASQPPHETDPSDLDHVAQQTSAE